MFFYRLKKVLPTGFALFTMLFGSGNLVFPLLIGSKALGAYPYSIIGLMISAILLSFVGLIGMMQSKGERNIYFQELPRSVYWVFLLIVFSIMGPFVVMPRCIHVAYGGLKELYPQLHLTHFSLFFSLVLFALAFFKDQIVIIMGKYLTPLKLGGILIVILGGFYFLPYEVLPYISPKEGFFTGLYLGYQPMDMLGVLFFSGIIYMHLDQQINEENINIACYKTELLKRSILAGSVGLSCIAIIYTLFLILGAKYFGYVKGLSAEMILPKIVNISLGSMATFIIAITLFLSTLATAVTLANIFVDFMCNELTDNLVSYHWGLALTVAVAFFMSLFGFNKIVEIGFSILSVLYPALVVFSIFKLIKLVIYEKNIFRQCKS